MDAAYLKAAHPEPFRILGKDLKPFCMGHELLLQRFGNRFSIESGEQPTVEDLAQAAYICSHPYSRGFNLDGFNIAFRARVWRRVFGQKYLLNALILFQQYIEAHTQIPEYEFDDKAKERETGTPLIQAVKICLMKHTKRSEDEVLNLPFALAFWDYLSFAESQENIRIIGVEAAARRKEEELVARAMEAKLEAMKSRIVASEEVSCSA
jgi:hypothetical protein